MGHPAEGMGHFDNVYEHDEEFEIALPLLAMMQFTLGLIEYELGFVQPFEGGVGLFEGGGLLMGFERAAEIAQRTVEGEHSGFGPVSLSQALIKAIVAIAAVDHG